jgi:hypothetical protein
MPQALAEGQGDKQIGQGDVAQNRARLDRSAGIQCAIPAKRTKKKGRPKAAFSS